MKKIVSIKPVGRMNVHDISVDEAEHYILENGVVSHNSGLIYSANQAFIIGKSQEKEGTEIVGWNFTLNVEKSRFVRERSKLPFLVTYNGGISKYSGLLDIALDNKSVIKPANGWYSRVDLDTGEIEDRKWRAKETDTKEFWEPLLANAKFQQLVKDRYQLKTISLDDSSEPTEDSTEDLDDE